MKKNSRVGQYVIVDARFSRGESAEIGGNAMRYFGSDLRWHRTLAETPAWTNRDKARVAAAPLGAAPQYTRSDFHVARIVAKKKVEPKKLNLLETIMDWDLMAELGRRFDVDPDHIDAAIEFIRTVK